LVKRTSRKRKLTLDNVVIVTTKETMFDAKKSKVSELLGKEWIYPVPLLIEPKNMKGK
jgi:hypothetical protein